MSTLERRLKLSKDWTGNRATTFSTLGASNHSRYERAEHDYYATDPVAIDMLAQTGFFDGVENVWEPACGGGHLANRMSELGLKVQASDLYDYGTVLFGQHVTGGVDFLKDAPVYLDDFDAIVTNPPYKYALEFCERGIELAPKAAMFLKLTFLEGAKRQAFFRQHPPRYVAVCVNRVQCARNGDKEMFAKSSAACYAWFIWEKGYGGRPEIIWVTK